MIKTFEHALQLSLLLAVRQEKVYNFCMGMTDRHKKQGGFKKLVNSLETTSHDKRVKILEAMAQEDPAFIDEVQKSIFEFSEFAKISDMAICELVCAFSEEMKTIALALYRLEDQALIDKFLRNMPPREMSAYRSAHENLTSVLGRERTSAQFRIINKARELEAQNKFTLKRYSSKYHIPE